MKRINAFQFSNLVVIALASMAVCRGAQVTAPAAPAPQQPVPQAASFCTNQPLCAEGYDFAAMITDFRTSEVNGLKVIDTTVHFVNKTNRPLILGYTDGSGMAIDDQGNRYGINGYAGVNAVRGIGRVAGNQIDPKFLLQPGQGGDALFELIWRPSGGAVGQTFEFDFTLREITPLEGNQFTLAGEFPLRFLGLTNGVGARPAAGAGYAPGTGGGLTATPAVGGAYAAGGMTATPAAGALAAAGPSAAAATAACTPGASVYDRAAAATNNLPAGAQSSVSQAQSAVSGLKSMFGRKKAAAAPAAGNPCPPAAPAAAAVPVQAQAPAYTPAPASAAPVAGSAALAPHAATTPAQQAAAGPGATTPNTAQAQAEARRRAAQVLAQQQAAAKAQAAKKKAATSAAAAATTPK